MTNLVMLNNVAHKNLRVITRFGAEFGDQIGTAVAFPNEFAALQREYPIFFRKDPATGEFQAVALLGFQKDENLFLDGSRWSGRYVPAAIARGPFLIGFQDQKKDGRVQRERVIHLDLDSPRVGQADGEPLFTPQGGNSPYLNHIAGLLAGIHDGLGLSQQMFKAYTDLDLIETVSLEIKLNANEGVNVVGLHTINQRKLQELDAAALEKLHKAGFLESAFLVLASMGNVNRLMAMKQRAAARAPAQTPMAS
jgi:hypothetical protein